MKRSLKFLAGAIATTGSVTLPLAVFAQSAFERARDLTDETAGAAEIGTTRELPEIIGSLINVVLGFLGILLLVYILYAGFLWMTAGGNEESVTKAKTMIKNAIIGLIIIVAAFAISNFVLTQLIERVAA